MKQHIGTTDIDAWLASHGMSRDTHPLIASACYLACLTGEDQLTPYGRPCFAHGLDTAETLINLEFDPQTIAAAIVYSTTEYSDLSIEDIALLLGEPIAHLVQGVHQMNLINQVEQQLRSRNVQQINNFRKMLLTMVRDVRAIVIKLADQLAILRSMQNLNEMEQKQVAHVAMEVFAPLANRLGLHQIKEELEDLAFRYLDQAMYLDIAKKLDESKNKREAHVKKIVATLEKALKEANIHATVYGRAKHIHSIKRKMMRKNVTLDQIYDATAVRILVKTLKDCYTALSIAHELWQPIPEEFDDYIALPKPNGYQSIHTAVIDPAGKVFEIQIRTYKMHEKSEKGVAAHWMYKEGGREVASYEEKIAWLRQLLEWQKSLIHDTAIPKALEKVIFEDRIYTFTPTGDIIDLPAGATPLDFAYHIHTEVGHRCRGAKINGKIAPLTRPLKTGDTVTILTTKTSAPSRDWLIVKRGYLKTSTARAKVLQWFKKQDIQTLAASGHDTLERELQRLSITNYNLEGIAKTLSYQSVDHMLAAIEGGHLKISRIVNAIHEKIEPMLPKQKPTLHKPKLSKSPVKITGIGNILARIALCCKPVPGDPIVGYITQGHGITVHHLACKNILRENDQHPNRLIKVYWNDLSKATYPVDIEILAYDRSGLMQEITSVLAQDQINILNINSSTNRTDNIAKILITVEIDNLELLGNILEKIGHIPNVYNVKRL